MPMKLALRLCPDAVVVRGDGELYSRYSSLVTGIIAERAPGFEKASIDEHYIDITGMDRFFGSLKWTQELRAEIMKETGLPISTGLSVNKTVSKIAANEAKPNGELFVARDRVNPFLDPLSIRKIPMIGDQTYRLLRSMGIANIYTLRMIPPEMAGKVMGKNGVLIWKKANGIDNTPVIPYHEQKSMSHECTFEQDTIDIKMMRNVLLGMVEKLAYELRKQHRLTGCVTVRIRYANFDTHSMQKKITYTSFDHILLSVVNELFDRVYERRMLIRLVGVRFSDLVYGFQQLDLFEDTPEKVNLYLSMDYIRQRFGNKAIRRAAGVRPRPVRYEPTVSDDRG
jgi:DNA polymerase-4